MRQVFEDKLNDLNNHLIEMGGYIEYAIKSAVSALVNQDLPLAKEIVEYDDKIDQKEKVIEHLCIQLLLMQQPVARDLRFVTCAIKMVTDMERIGDQSADIAQKILQLKNTHNLKKLTTIQLMADAAIKMVNDAIDAYIKKDIKLAHAVINYDDIVDDYFAKVKSELVEMVKKDKENCESFFDLFLIAKYLERIGDHSTNIAEWVVFSLTGTHDYDKIS